MEIIIICAILGCIPGAIASSKGRSFGLWWLYGALLFIVALIHSLCIGKDLKALENEQITEGLVKCPYCAEMIKPEAIKCKHCGSDIQSRKEQILVNDIASHKVTTRLGGELIVDSFKVNEIVRDMLRGNSGKDKKMLVEAYGHEISKIKSQIPQELHERLDDLIYDSIQSHR